MAVTRVLVTVMTYPSLSDKHFETVCTAGFREDGSWIRIFPVPYRLLDQFDKSQYSKWQWIEADLEQNPSHDDRPESYHIRDIESLKVLDRIDTKGKPNWNLRKQWALKNKKVFDNMSELIDLTKKNQLSLAVLKPTEIIDVKYEQEDLTKYKEKLAKVKSNYDASKAQMNLFCDNNDMDFSFKFAEKIPYKFRYVFKTKDGIERKLMIEDWELGALFRKYPDEKIAVNKVVEKYRSFINNDIYFFLGTSFQWQKKNAPDPYLIIGVFYPPKSLQNFQTSIDFMFN